MGTAVNSICSLCSSYGNIRQRWLLVHSQQAYERESKQLDKRVARAKEKAEKEWRTLQKSTFQCQADAQAAAARLGEKLPWHRPQAQVVPLKLQLAAQNQTIPDQKGKPTQTPTMRRIAQIFEGLDILIIQRDNQILSRQILNMTNVHRTIISLLSSEVQYCYLVDF